MTLENGSRLGHYRILSLLGRGGMADVYRAEDERLGREVALKAVPPEFARDPERIERFEREVRAAARLAHPNIVQVYEFGQGAGQHFYTMALMPGGDLKARIRAHPDGMPEAEAKAVAAAVARALDYAHRQGLVHRDVKPENILFWEDGTPQLTDFGIARAMTEGTRMTATGMSIGSPHYMSPEQAQGLEVDGRSDLYSLGVVLYEMFTGRLPFDAPNTFAVGLRHIKDPVPELPRALAEWQPVVDRLLAKSPEDRYGSAGELAEVLGEDSLPRPAAMPMPSVGRGSDFISDVAPRAPVRRVMPEGTEVVPTRQAGESRTRLVEPPKPRGGPRSALAGAVLALAVVGIGYLALRDTSDPKDQRVSGGGGGAQVRSEPVRPEPERRQLRAGTLQVFDGIEFVWIPAGEFRMGSTGRRAYSDEEPLTRVRITRGYWLGKYEVTQGQWEGVMGGNPSRFENCGEDCPVERVSWNDVQAFIRKLNGRSGGSRYRLPTEAEWEYGARSGTSTDTYAGDVTEPGGEDPVVNRIAWYDENSGGRTHRVGRKGPNAFGLHDMMGNVWEWVGDWYGDYPGGTVTDPVGPVSGSNRVLRGGSWGNYARNCRSAYRDWNSPGIRYGSLGFRLLRTE